MSAEDGLAVVRLLRQQRIATWVDGGWGVDALLGEQTRSHEDLDLVIALADSDEATDALAAAGYALSVDERPTRLVLSAGERSIDLHTVTFDQTGDDTQQLQDGSMFVYPASGFAAVGHIDGEAVQCLSVEVQLASHLGYEPDSSDRQDMAALARRFGIELPSPYDPHHG